MVKVKQTFSQRVTLIIALFSATLLFAPTVKAVADPPLFSCVNPVGSLIAAYDSGVHGIPGDSNTYTGRDRVYQVDESHVLQCFCPENAGSGIQSNWYKVVGLTQEDIEFFVRRGWVHVPNGALWGLSNAPYLVKNDTYQCQNGGTGGSSGGSSSSSNTSNSSSGSSSESNPGRGGSILGASTLATTGNTLQIAGLFFASIFLSWVGYKVSQE